MTRIMVTLKDIWDAQMAIPEVDAVKWNTKGGYRVGKIMRKITRELREINEHRLELINEISGKGDGDFNKLTDKQKFEIDQRFNEYLDQEAEPMELLLLDEAALGNVQLSGQVYRLLHFIFDDLDGKQPSTTSE